MNILHISRKFYAKGSTIGGGEKYVIYTCRALKKAAATLGLAINTSILSLGEVDATQQDCEDIAFKTIRGCPHQIESIDVDQLIKHIELADIVHIHQCLTPFGLFAAAHSRLLGKRVLGSDHGGEPHYLVAGFPNLGLIFDFLHAYSDFGLNSLKELSGITQLIKGPVDTDLYKPHLQPRIPNLVIAVGRMMAHKGFDRIIKVLPEGLTLKIIGSAVDADYKQHLLSLSHNKDVHLLEELSDSEVLAYLRSASLFVHASTHLDCNGHVHAKPELLGLAPLEALSTGLTTLVSDAGSLAELSVIPGCFVFHNDLELEHLLINFRDKQLQCYNADFMHSAVIQHYGLEQFGKKMLSLISSDF